MSSLTDSLPTPQTEPPQRGRAIPKAGWHESVPSSSRSLLFQFHTIITLELCRAYTFPVEIRQRSTSPSTPPASRKNDDHVYSPAGLLNQTPPPPPPPPEQVPDKFFKGCFLDDVENYSGRFLHVVPARAARKDSLLSDEREESTRGEEWKEDRQAVCEEERPPPPKPLEVDQLPASVIDRLWFGVEPERKLTQSPTPVLNKDRGKSKHSSVRGSPEPRLMVLGNRPDPSSVGGELREPRGVDRTGHHASNDTVIETQRLQLKIDKRDDRVSTGSTKTQDSGYESAFNVFDDQTEDEEMFRALALDMHPLDWAAEPASARRNLAPKKPQFRIARTSRRRETTPTKRPGDGKGKMPAMEPPETSVSHVLNRLRKWMVDEKQKEEAWGFAGPTGSASGTPSSPGPSRCEDKDIEPRGVTGQTSLSETPGILPQSTEVQTPCADSVGGSSPPVASDVSSPERETPPEAPSSDTPGFPETPETPETSACSSVANDDAGVESASDGETTPRTPSPWQQADDEDASLRLAIALSQITRGVSEMLSSQGSADSSLSSSRTASPETAPVDDCRTHAGGAGPSGALQAATSPAATDSGARPVADSGAGGARKSRLRGGGSDRDWDDGDGNEPNPKRRKPGTPEEAVARRRFACPYQKHDPLGSPFCCTKTSKNQEGGAENFSRVK